MVLRGKLAALICLTLMATGVSAQELEPRAYSNAPTGLRFLVIAYGHSTGDLVFDPTLPVEDANANVNIGAIGYVSTVGLFGKTSKLSVVLPYADGKATGLLNGQPAERVVSGLADARIGVSWLFYGAPARTVAEFLKANRSRTVAGLSVVASLPTGRYQEERLINIGTNRYSLKTELGITHNFEKWTIEGAAAATVFQDNDEWLVTSTREQDPIYSVQAHIVRDFRPRLWVALDFNYYWGGQAKVDGALSGLELGNSRVGMTVSLPVGRTQSLKLTASSGVSVRTGTDFDSYGVAWQWAIPPKM
jgi:hypothetical protein